MRTSFADEVTATRRALAQEPHWAVGYPNATGADRTPAPRGSRHEDALLATVIQHAPAWVRYVLTLSEIGRSERAGCSLPGDDIAIMDAGGTSAMPLWPYRELAEGAQRRGRGAGGSAHPPRARLALSAVELTDKILPALAENEVSVAVFPGPGREPAHRGGGSRCVTCAPSSTSRATSQPNSQPSPTPSSSRAGPTSNVPDLGERRRGRRRALLVARDRRRRERDRRCRKRQARTRALRDTRDRRGVRSRCRGAGDTTGGEHAVAHRPLAPDGVHRRMGRCDRDRRRRLGRGQAGPACARSGAGRATDGRRLEPPHFSVERVALHRRVARVARRAARARRARA